MSAQESEIGLVGSTIRDLLPTVNEGFNWDIVKDRFDENPVGTAMSLHFTDESGETAIEQVHLGIVEGPKIVVLDRVDESWDYLGAIVTYQNFGLRILDPEDEMTPSKARYQHRGVTIHPAENESRTRVWLVVSKVLDVLLESVIYESNQSENDTRAASMEDESRR